MYEIIKKSRKLNLSIDTQIDMFDKMVTPILLYGCELWGFENVDIIERLHLRFCKLVLNLKKSTPNFMIYGELARYPLYINIRLRMIDYWIGILNGKETKFNHILYNFTYMLSTDVDNVFQFKWINCIQNILQNCGLNFIWLSQRVENKKWLLSVVKQTLKDQFQQNWIANCNASSKGLFYNLFTNYHFSFRKYLDLDLPRNNTEILARFRTSNHRLPIETGRWTNIPRNQRTCNLCGDGLGDEYHYIMI